VAGAPRNGRIIFAKAPEIATPEIATPEIATPEIATLGLMRRRRGRRHTRRGARSRVQGMALGQTVVGAVLALGVGLHGARAAAKTKIACVGASTTSGDGSSAGHHYPDELQRLVAPDGEVKNFGVSGTTMLRNVSASYWKTPALGQALAYVPDVVIIWFGGNDAKPENWTAHKGEFLGDYEAMLQMFQALPSHPRTYVVLSLLTRDTEGIPKSVVDGEVIPLVRQAAAETGSGIVNVHDELVGHPEYFPDGIHPNDVGTIAVAKLVYAALNAPLPNVDGGVDATGPDAPPATGGGAPDASPPPPAPDGGPSPSLDAAPIGTAPADAAAPPVTSTGADAGPAGGGGASGSPPHAAHNGGCAVGGDASSGPCALLLILLLTLLVLREARTRSPRRTCR
jgi:acyl-CoA thioesterase-1